MDIALILYALVPGARYGGSLTDNTRKAYEAIRWEDERPQPSYAAIKDAATRLMPQRAIQAELDMLDQSISRLEEDLVAATGIQLWGEKAKTLTRKKQLRQQLKEMGVSQ